MDQNPLLVVLGPTASGKTRLAAQLAYGLNGAVISADSRQVFRGMDIGTGKDIHEYMVDGCPVPYHLIDIKNAGEQYNVDAYKEDFYQVLEKLSNAKVLPVLCGGTGMYIHSILQNHEYTAVPVNEEIRAALASRQVEELRDILAGYPSEFTVRADQSSVKRLIRAIEIAAYLQHNVLAPKARPSINPLIIGLNTEVPVRRKRIADRLELRLNNGLIEEVEHLLDSGVSREMLTFYGLEYKFVVSYLSKEIDMALLKERLFIAICQFAKRQMTFFRKMEKDGVKIHWFDAEMDPEEIKNNVFELYAQTFDA